MSHSQEGLLLRQYSIGTDGFCKLMLTDCVYKIPDRKFSILKVFVQTRGDDGNIFNGTLGKKSPNQSMISSMWTLFTQKISRSFIDT